MVDAQLAFTERKSHSAGENNAMLKLEVLFSSSFSLLLLLDDELKLHALHSILIGERWKMRKLLWITFFLAEHAATLSRTL